MAAYSFSEVAVWDNLGGAVRPAGNLRVDVLDPGTGATVAGLTDANGNPAPFITSDSKGHLTFSADVGIVKLSAANGLSQLVTSPDYTPGSAASGVQVVTLAGDTTLTTVARTVELTGTGPHTITIPAGTYAATITNSTDYDQTVIRSGATVGAVVPAGETINLLA